MQKTIQIKCIRRANHWKPRDSISHVGGGALANHWKLELDEVIQKIESGACMFFVHVDSDPVAVNVAVDRDGKKYIKTVADGDFPTHLLSLPECP
ncbi:hypothetical protein FHS00_003443 [Limimaricola variabilis]|uniref:DUF3892 domain-containing protein n=1 Tax=Limimaricola variabilis TaxID=1492771 RepID=A0ABR6HTE6_9RHOB|nr:hypothetical protein [Limimaricola variabilis]